ncbi:MAG: DMT family transporter [Lachnospira sp.]
MVIHRTKENIGRTISAQIVEADKIVIMMISNTNSNNKGDYLQKTWVVCVLALVCTFLWGSASPCIKIGYELFNIPAQETWTQVLFAGTRFVLAGVLTIVIGSLLGRKVLVPTKSSAKGIVVLGMCQTVLQYIFFYIGLAHNSGVKSSIINGSNTFLVILVACLIFRQEKLDIRKVLGCIVGFAGVILVCLNGEQIDAGFSFQGEGSLFLAALAYAFSSSFMKIFSKKDNPVMLSGYQFIFGGFVMIIMGLLLGGRITRVSVSAVMMLIYLALISSVAYSLWGILLKHNPVSKVAIFGFTNPVFGVVLSAWWLGEGTKELGLKAVLALVLVSIGICIVNVKKEKGDK